jgi:hypothetical protein
MLWETPPGITRAARAYILAEFGVLAKYSLKKSSIVFPYRVEGSPIEVLPTNRMEEGFKNKEVSLLISLNDL